MPHLTEESERSDSEKAPESWLLKCMRVHAPSYFEADIEQHQKKHTQKNIKSNPGEGVGRGLNPSLKLGKGLKEKKGLIEKKGLNQNKHLKPPLPRELVQ